MSDEESMTGEWGERVRCGESVRDRVSMECLSKMYQKQGVRCEKERSREMWEEEERVIKE